MIQYNTKDVLRKAKQLADLENSDFISYNESLTLLNEAYSKLYQTTIDSGDLLYLKKIELQPAMAEDDDERIQVYRLPNDFYQLYSVKDKILGVAGMPIYRRIKDGPLLERSYEIRNEYIYIYGPLHSIEIEYFPIPRTLYIKNNDIKVDNTYGKPVAYYKDTILFLSNATLTAVLNTDSSVLGTWTLPEGAEFSRAALGTNGMIVWLKDGSVITSDFGEEATTITAEDMVAKTILREDEGLFIEDAPMPEVKFILANENETYMITKDDIGKEYIEGHELTGTGNHIDTLEEGYLFITNSDGGYSSYNIYTEDLNYFESKLEKVIEVGDYNISNGYGILTQKRGRGYYISSLFEDTSLDYPNNFYFTMLAYLLAMSYKIKQNGDISSLQVAYSDTEKQYYDMLHRDVNQPLRMNNVIHR